MSVALVTGATGLVGSHIVEALLAGGWTVRALARDPARAAGALPEAVEVRTGDVLDEASFARAAAGCHTIFHCAAVVLARGGLDAYRVTNVEGTRNAVAAAEWAGARLLHMSSVAVYGPSARYEALRRGERTDEATPLAPLREGAYYARTKRESEAVVLEAHQRGRIWATAVRPTVVYGPRDRVFVPRIARLVSRGVVPLVRGGRSIMSVVHAANVADGAVRAATIDGAGGKAYNLANDFDVTVRRFFELAALGIDRRVRFVPLPMWSALAALRAARWVTSAVSGGKYRMIGSSALAFVSEDNPFASERARRELGWSPRVQPEAGVPAAFGWWKSRIRE